MASIDFILGSLLNNFSDETNYQYSYEKLINNLYPDYQDNENLYTVFGVFFPTATGILTGINMAGDLKHPHKNIAVGTLSAICISTIFYILFVLIIGFSCSRNELRSDYMILVKISGVRVLFLAGLYISSISCSMASLYGSPRIIQSIAEVNAIPFSSFLRYTKGPNNIPVLATLLVTIISVVFICIGNINYVGPIVTIGFLLTYAFVNYAYFALMTTKQYEKIKNSNSAINRLDDEFNIPNMPKYLALFGSIVSVAIIFFINWIYALLNVMSLIIVYYYIHKYATGLLMGMAKYNLLDWFKYTILRKKFKTKIILDYKFETASTVPQQQNHVNSDFQKRNNYHQSVKISNILDFSDI